MKRGFSLVELSIVLVILGLLVGGVLSGQSLIRAAEIRSISTDLSRYTTAIYTFRDKYLALPGDMANATAFWGKDNTNCTGDTGTAQVPGTCNGDADGVIEVASAASTTGEMFQTWKHLALAGLIEGSYTGIAGTLGTSNTIIDVNTPKGRFSSSGFTLNGLDPATPIPYPGDTQNFYNDRTVSTLFTFGTQNGAVATSGRLLKSEDVWNVDTKIDDGKPGLGKMISIYWDECTLATSETDISAAYDLTAQGANCALRYYPF